MSRPFLKMNGLGNDFVVVDARAAAFSPTAEEVRAIADRAEGVGCDQLVSIEPSDKADARVRFWNADGEEVGACGNASRCIGWLLMRDSGQASARFETRGGAVLTATRAGDTAISVDMGEPGLDWRQIPLAEEMDTVGIPLSVDEDLYGPGCVSMGNPHVVFWVEEIDAAPVTEVGPIVERHWLFPEGVNVGFAEVRGRDHIRLRVWERGAGLTQACGTGACAALVASVRRDLVDRKARLELDGGDLTVEWREADNHVIMTGAVEVEFEGQLP
jgi:diaminopimelate epimerase